MFSYRKPSAELVFLWNQVGEDVVAELQTAMGKQGLDIHVAALVSVRTDFLYCQSSISNLWFQQIL